MAMMMVKPGIDGALNGFPSSSFSSLFPPLSPLQWPPHRTPTSRAAAGSPPAIVAAFAGSEYSEELRKERNRGRSDLSAIANGRESQMVPVEEALKKAKGIAEKDDKEKSRNGVSVNGIESYSSNGLPRTGNYSSTNPSSTSLMNGSAMVDMRRSSKIKRSLLKAPSHPPEWDQDIRSLPSDVGFSWAKEDYNSLQRTIDVWSFILSLRARVFLDEAKWTYIGGFTEEKQRMRRRGTASWTREKIIQLGPTFIKLGQLSSTRSDLFPAEFIEELSKLQDQVPAFSDDKAIDLIEKELGGRVDMLFSYFEKRPIAAASLGQVHRAVLLSGELVVVKIQRPGLKELFDIDLRNLKVIAEYFQNREAMSGRPATDWVGVYEECANILYQEIDYIKEGRSADKFRRDYRNIKWVRVPKIYWDYSSTKILTMEYVPGIKINDVAALGAGGYDLSQIASRAVESYLIQILKTGFFHADPHPGNLAIDVDGSLIYYDFGMTGEIKAFTREKLLQMFYAVSEKDAKKWTGRFHLVKSLSKLRPADIVLILSISSGIDPSSPHKKITFSLFFSSHMKTKVASCTGEVIQALVDLGALTPTGDMSSVRRSIQFFLNNIMDQKQDQVTTISAIGEDLFSIAVDQPFRFPATFTFVLRAFSTLEGIGYTLNPDFSFAKIAAPYAQELLDVRDSRKNGNYFVQELQRQATDARDATVSMPLRIQRIDEFMQQLEAGDLKLRVRVLEAERAARRASVLQSATMNTVAGATLLNIGVTLNGQGQSNLALASFAGSGVFMTLVAFSMRRIKQIDNFEKML